jgi:hypothetical protein
MKFDYRKIHNFKIKPTRSSLRLETKKVSNEIIITAPSTLRKNIKFLRKHNY